jgi:hypothetical protein
MFLFVLLTAGVKIKNHNGTTESCGSHKIDDSRVRLEWNAKGTEKGA